MNIDEEVCDWLHLFVANNNYKKLILKGGSALGLYIMQILMMYAEKKPDNLVKFYHEHLIKDWDFALYDCNVDDLNLDNRFRQEGVKIKVIRHVHKTMINDEALIELAIHNKSSVLSDLSDVELPMTLVHIVFNEINDIRNMMYFIKLYRSFTTETIISKYDEIYNFIGSLNIIVCKCKNGLLDVAHYSKHIHYGSLSKYAKIFDSFVCNTNEKQFLISHFSQLDRLLSRLFFKNIPKAEKINKFLQMNDINVAVPILSIGEDYLWELANNFIIHLYKNLIEGEINALCAKQIDLGVFTSLQKYYASCLVTNKKYSKYKVVNVGNNGDDDASRLDQISKVLDLDLESRTINIIKNICDEKILDKIFKQIINKDLGLNVVNFFDGCNLVRAHILLKKNPKQIVNTKRLFQSFVSLFDNYGVNIYKHIQPKSNFSRFMRDVIY